MAASAVSEQLVVQSHRGPYSAIFQHRALARLGMDTPSRVHFIVDANVAALYEDELGWVLNSPSVLLLPATENTKSLDKFTAYVEHLLERGVRRSHLLVAIGGGTIQDVCCFLAATLFRGLHWHFYPTTLLAQADSCIGSKSSINVGRSKNVLGTFTPPTRIVIDTTVLATLDENDVRSGIGEMLKVHAIDGPNSFDQIAADYRRILTDPATMNHYIFRSLEIKKAIVELDEFDRGPRNVMNYGHSFGHAIESATNFEVPHGIAVTIGMDMANYVAVRFRLADERHYRRMHPTLASNYVGFEEIGVPLDVFLDAIARDKKNTDAGLTLILPDAAGRVSPRSCAADGAFRNVCADYFATGRYR